MSAEETRVEIYHRLDTAVVDLMRVLADMEAAEHECDQDCDDCPEPAATVTDWVLIIGSQFYTPSGDRAGNIRLIPRHGSQPSYITAGLMNQALALLNE